MEGGDEVSSVDNRVVEMKFNNAQFEKETAQSTSSLEKLTAALGNLTNTNTGNAQKNLQTISNRFTRLGVMGTTALANVTNRMVNFGFKTAGAIKRLAVTGGLTRAMNIAQAKFQLEGLGVSWEKVSKDIDYGVKDTAYGFDSAAKAAGQLSASGIKLGDEMKTSLRAISGLASMTGSSYDDIANIFTTVAGNGRIMGEQLLQISSRGINAAAVLKDYINSDAKLRKQLVEAGEHSQVAKRFKDIGDNAKLTEENIRDMCSAGVIDFRIFSKAMDEAYGQHAKDANKTFTGALSNMKAAMARIGADFFGDFSTNKGGILFWARDTLNALIPLIDKVHELIKTNIIPDFYKAGNSISKNLVGAINSITKALSGTGKGTKYIKALGNIFAALTTTGQVLFKIFTALGKAALTIGGALLQTTGAFAGFMAKANGAILKGNVLKGVLNGIGVIASGVARIIHGLGAGIGKLVSYLGDGISKMMGSLAKATNNGASLEKMFNTAAISGILYMLVNMSKALKSPMRLIENIIYSFADTAGPFKVAMINVKNTLVVLQSQVKSKILLNIAKAMLMLAAAMTVLAYIPTDRLSNALIALTGIAVILGTFTAAINKLFAEDNLFVGVKNMANLASVSASLVTISIAMLVMSAAVKNLSSIDMKALARGMVSITVLLGEMFVFTKAMSSENPEKIVKGLGSLVLFAGAISILASAVRKLSSLNVGELAKGLISVSILIAGVAAVSKCLGKGAGLLQGIALIALAKSIDMLTESVTAFSKLKPANIVKGMASLAALMLLITITSKKLDGGGGLLVSAVAMTIMAKAVSGFADSVALLGGLKIASLVQGFTALASVFILIGTAAKVLSVGFKDAVAISIMAASINTLAAALYVLAQLSLKEVVVSLVALAGGLAVIGGTAALLGGLAGPMLAFSGALTVLGVALLAAGAGVSLFAGGVATLVATGAGGISVIKAMCMSLIETVAGLGKAIGIGFIGLLNVIAANIGPVSVAAGKIIVGFLAGISGNIGKIVQAGIDILLGLMKGILNNIGKITTVAVQIVVGFVTAISGQIGTLIDAGINLAIAFINGLANGIRNNAESFYAAIRNLLSATLELFITGLQQIVKTIPGVGPAASKALETVKTNIRKTLAPESFKTDGKKIGEATAKGVASTTGANSKAGQSAGKAAEAGYNRGSAGSKRRGATAGKNAAKGLSGTASLNTKAGQKIASSALKGSGSRLGDMSRIGKDSGGRFASGVGSKDDKAKSQGNKLGRGAKKGAKEGSSGMHKEGSNAGQGFVNGIMDFLGRAFDAGKKLSSNAVKGAKSGHKSNSPSKLQKKQGEYAGQGFIIGLNAYIDKAYKAGYRMSSASLDGVRKACDNMSNIIDNISDVDPVIRPVVDMSDVNRGKKYISSVFGDIGFGLSANASVLSDVNARQDDIIISEIRSLKKELSRAVESNTVIEPSEIYAAVRMGASDATISAPLDGRELVRGLAQRGVVVRK